MADLHDHLRKLVSSKEPGGDFLREPADAKLATRLLWREATREVMVFSNNLSPAIYDSTMFYALTNAAVAVQRRMLFTQHAMQSRADDQMFQGMLAQGSGVVCRVLDADPFPLANVTITDGENMMQWTGSEENSALNMRNPQVVEQQRIKFETLWVMGTPARPFSVPGRSTGFVAGNPAVRFVGSPPLQPS